jgi:hypothetical protein
VHVQYAVVIDPLSSNFLFAFQNGTKWMWMSLWVPPRGQWVHRQPHQCREPVNVYIYIFIHMHTPYIHMNVRISMCTWSP